MGIVATRLERVRPLPGDELVAAAKLNTTHAISIRAAAADVWPWLVQMGQGRGGLYSYTWIENWIGCRMRNANRIHPEWQTLSVGDEVSLHPKASPLLVAALCVNQHLVLQSSAGFPWSWAFVLSDDGEKDCRLLVRTRVGWSNPVLSLFLWPVMGPGHYVMERKMMHGIRVRAERL